MKTLLLTAVIAAAGTPVLAQGWNNNDCGPTSSNYGRIGSSYSSPKPGYGPYYGSGIYGNTRDPWAYRGTVPPLAYRNTYDTVHRDHHLPVNRNYNTSYRNSTWDRHNGWDHNDRWDYNSGWDNGLHGRYRY